MLAMAHFLSTRTEPKIYYKPWELLPEHEESIKAQISEAEALIAREVQEFNNRYPKESPNQEKKAPVGETIESTSDKETVGEPRTESPSVPVSTTTSAVTDTTNPTTQAPPQTAGKGKEKEKDMEEHNGEVVVENEEDTVIY
jgi:cell division septation protein DedD